MTARQKMAQAEIQVLCDADFTNTYKPNRREIVTVGEVEELTSYLEGKCRQ